MQMPEATTDRRVRRTRQLLRDALMELTLERGYDRVTVQDILDKADVGRSTFYAHYRDKDDLLVSEFEALHPSLSFRPSGTDEGPAGTVGFLEPLRGAFRDAEADRRRYKAFVGRQGSDAVRRLLPEPLSNMVGEHIRAQFPEWQGDDQRLAAVARYIVSAFLGTLTWWLDTDAPFTGDEIFTICRSLAVEGAESFFSI
jgi:AcrR family transcriptional regulator